ncbi:MAG TPA: hypothetical protein VLN46_06585, partial [Gillisia sp.]|nr:hypothetical protein [Gillisia sp.]
KGKELFNFKMSFVTEIINSIAMDSETDQNEISTPENCPPKTGNYNLQDTTYIIQNLTSQHAILTTQY